MALENSEDFVINRILQMDIIHIYSFFKVVVFLCKLQK